MSKWTTEFSTVSDLWIDADATPVKSPIVVIGSTDTDMADVREGFARVNDDWYRVVCIGEGDWQAQWSDRQQRFVTATSEEFIEKLNAFAGITA